MKSPDDKVALYDSKGNQVGYKLRRDVDKKSDILGHAGILLVGTERQIYLTKPRHSLWPTQWAGSSAGLILYDEPQ